MSDPTDSGTPPIPSSKSGGLLNKKVGGVPVKWLALAVLLVVGGYFVYRHFRPAITTTATGDVTSADTGTSTDPGNLFGGYSDSLDGTTSGLTSATSYTTPTGVGITTNLQWAQNAANGLDGTGSYTELDVQNALNNYITGASLTAAQQAIVNAALGSYGSPPESIIGSVSSAPASLTGTTHVYTSKTGDTVSGVLQRTYGQVDQTLKDDFYKVNPKGLSNVRNPHQATGYDPITAHDAIKPGQALYLPVFSVGTLP